MIRNIVFDIGNVLAEFCWQKAFDKLGFTGERRAVLTAATVKGPWWNEYDRSVLSDAEIAARCAALAGEYANDVYTLFAHPEYLIETYPYARDWIPDLRARGYRVFLLSNFGKTSFEANRPKMDFLDAVDGGVISYEVGELKPDRAIFRALEEKYALDPAECIFLDDNADNIAAARSFGYHALLFESKERAEREILEIGKR